MKDLFKILSISILLFFSANIFAQQENKNQQRNNTESRRKWHEDFKIKKQEFLTKDLDLTPSQADAFFPLYWELQMKKFDIQKKNREQFHKIMNDSKVVSEKEYADMAVKMAEDRVKEEELNVVYMKKFLKVIPGKALLKLQFAEMEFNKTMMQKAPHPRQGKNDKDAYINSFEESNYSLVSCKTKCK